MELKGQILLQVDSEQLLCWDFMVCKDFYVLVNHMKFLFLQMLSARETRKHNELNGFQTFLGLQ